MKKIICIKNNTEGGFVCHHLTIGKEYECFDTYFNNDVFYFCAVRDDNNESMLFPKNYFLTLEEYRDKKLKELGI